jgi:hypothetical protein
MPSSQEQQQKQRQQQRQKQQQQQQQGRVPSRGFAVQLAMSRASTFGGDSAVTSPITVTPQKITATTNKHKCAAAAATGDSHHKPPDRNASSISSSSNNNNKNNPSPGRVFPPSSLNPATPMSPLPINMSPDSSSNNNNATNTVNPINTEATITAAAVTFSSSSSNNNNATTATITRKKKVTSIGVGNEANHNYETVSRNEPLPIKLQRKIRTVRSKRQAFPRKDMWKWGDLSSTELEAPTNNGGGASNGNGNGGGGGGSNGSTLFCSSHTSGHHRKSTFLATGIFFLSFNLLFILFANFFAAHTHTHTHTHFARIISLHFTSLTQHKLFHRRLFCIVLLLYCIAFVHRLFLARSASVTHDTSNRSVLHGSPLVTHWLNYSR